MMMRVPLDFLWLTILAAACPTPTFGQNAVPAVGPGSPLAPSAASIPDFSGIWGHPSWPGFEPPASGPGPVVNKSRLREGPQRGVRNPDQMVGDYTSPILKPLAAEAVKKFGEVELSGAASPTPSNRCWPEPVPYIFLNFGIQILQQPHQITILYDEDHEVRHVRMNQGHPAQVIPSWYGDSVGHYEGDTLVIDTVGIKADRPLAIVDLFGTPYSSALHVVERYRLLDYEDAKEGLNRNAKENFDLNQEAAFAVYVDPNYRGKHLQLQFAVEDEGVFTVPWSATITYRRGFTALSAESESRGIGGFPKPLR
jgi:hypothetical protein